MNRVPGKWPFVRLTKFAIPAEPDFATSRMSAYDCGLVNPKCSLPLGYWLEGWLVHPPTVGHCVRMLRINRNGVQCLGSFASTPVVSLLDELSFATANSFYRVASVEPPRALSPEVYRALDRLFATDTRDC
jgi:hypothetical protein